MMIPKDLALRQLLYSEVAEACLSSRAERVADYMQRQNFYLFGCAPGGTPAEFNRTLACIKNLKAFIYAADSTSFTLDVGVSTSFKKAYTALVFWLRVDTNELIAGVCMAISM
jgi:hypothetical protein